MDPEEAVSFAPILLTVPLVVRFGASPSLKTGRKPVGQVIVESSCGDVLPFRGVVENNITVVAVVAARDSVWALAVRPSLPFPTRVCP